MARKYQHTQRLLPQIKKMIKQGMTQKEVEDALGLTDYRPVHDLFKEILEQETDANHGITMARILEFLSMRGIKAERKSIYDDIRAFRESEYLDVTVPQGQNREYSVASRAFEIFELKMIIDAIQSSKFLSEAKMRDLIKKLESQCSKYEASTLQRQGGIANRVKSVSKVLFRNVDTIHSAIAKNAQICLDTFNRQYIIYFWRFCGVLDNMLSYLRVTLFPVYYKMNPRKHRNIHQFK